jgi:hypothetical protein
MLALVLTLVFAFALTMKAGTITVQALFGTGNTNFQNGSLQNGITMAVQAKVRDTGELNTSNGIDFYMPLGYSALNPARSAWNLEFAVATPLSLDNYQFVWWVRDYDPTGGVLFLGDFSGVLALDIPDNSYGTFGYTGNGQGVEDNNPTIHNFMGNSENALFLGFNPYEPGIYSAMFDVYDKAGNNVLASSTLINVHIGETRPVQSAPDNGSTAVLLGLPRRPAIRALLPC